MSIVFRAGVFASLSAYYYLLPGRQEKAQADHVSSPGIYSKYYYKKKKQAVITLGLFSAVQLLAGGLVAGWSDDLCEINWMDGGGCTGHVLFSD